jgi:hypothetical protein
MTGRATVYHHHFRGRPGTVRAYLRYPAFTPRYGLGTSTEAEHSASSECLRDRMIRRSCAMSNSAERGAFAFRGFGVRVPGGAPVASSRYDAESPAVFAFCTQSCTQAEPSFPRRDRGPPRLSRRPTCQSWNGDPHQTRRGQPDHVNVRAPCDSSGFFNDSRYRIDGSHPDALYRSDPRRHLLRRRGCGPTVEPLPRAANTLTRC